MSDRFDNDDFDDFDDENNEDDPHEWDEEQWEAFFQEEDERHRRFEELLDKYGHTEEGLRRVFKEMGWEVPDFEDEDNIDEEPPESDDIDDMLEEQYGNWESDFVENIEDAERFAHPLFKKLYRLINETLTSFRNVEVESEADPIVTFQRGLLEAMSKLFHAGYYNLDSRFEAPRGLVLAALKRVRKSLFSSLFSISEIKQANVIKQYRLDYYHQRITDILRDVNSELSETRRK